jgi:pSer/pThr/pTyr-binding forkhead associated (FHA) protein
MGDHLNSMHLDAPRREEFRLARSRLLDACGDLTRHVVVQQGTDESPDDSKTMVQQLEKRLPADTTYALLDKDSVYPLKVGLNTVGRLPDNDVVIEDAFVSRRHCAILIHASNGSELHDVASKNGTFLNGSRLAGPAPIHSGDEIRMCDRQLVFVDRAELNRIPGHDATLPK